MPCRTDYDNDDSDVELELVTRVACELARIIKRHVPSFGHLVSKETQRWVSKHEEADRRRLEREEKERNDKRLLKEALRKLTSEECRVLGYSKPR